MTGSDSTEELFDQFEARFPKTARAVRDGMTAGLHRGCQIYVSLGGQSRVDVGLGDACETGAMTAGTINLWRSSGKPMTAAALLRQIEVADIDLHDPVQKHIREFVDGSVRIDELLTHTSGLPNVDVGWPDRGWNEVLAQICQLQRDPEVRAAYSYFVTWFLLGEIVRRWSGYESFAEMMCASVFEPLGMMRSWIGMHSAVWSELSDDIAQVETMTLGGRRRVEQLHELRFCAPASPGANLRSTARDVGRFYETLQNGEYFASSETLELMTRPHRVDLVDATFKAKVRMGLGVVLASDDPSVPYGFGDHCSPRTFGHGGAQCAMAFCDPEHELVVAWVVNGFPGEPRHQERNRAINSAIYEDLSLT